MKKILSVLLAVSMLVSALFLLASCSEKKKVITIYATSEDFRIKNAQQMLNEKFPEYKIKVEYRSTGELAAKLANEGKKTDEDVQKVFAYLLSDVTPKDKELYAPEQIYKDRTFTIKNFPTDIPYADMRGNDDTAVKERLLDVWKY